MYDMIVLIVTGVILVGFFLPLGSLVSPGNSSGLTIFYRYINISNNKHEHWAKKNLLFSHYLDAIGKEFFVEKNPAMFCLARWLLIMHKSAVITITACASFNKKSAGTTWSMMIILIIPILFVIPVLVIISVVLVIPKKNQEKIKVNSSTINRYSLMIMRQIHIFFN